MFRLWHFMIMMISKLIIRIKTTVYPILLVPLLFTIVSCASTDKDLTDKQAYDLGMSYMESEDYISALTNFSYLQNRYPTSIYNRHAYIESIYANFILGDFLQVDSLARRFDYLYPTDEQIHYALYLRGMALFNADKSLFENYVFTDLSQRDLGLAFEALGIFTALVDRYPNSPYAWEAYKRIIFIKNRLAEREMDIARHYYVREDYIAAISRCNNVLNNYISSPQALYALATLENIYNLLNMKEEADKARELLNIYDPEFKIPDDYLKY